MLEKDCVPRDHRQALNTEIARLMLNMGTLPSSSEWSQRLHHFYEPDNQQELEWLFGDHLQEVITIFQESKLDSSNGKKIR